MYTYTPYIDYVYSTYSYLLKAQVTKKFLEFSVKAEKAQTIKTALHFHEFIAISTIFYDLHCGQSSISTCSVVKTSKGQGQLISFSSQLVLALNVLH